MSNSIHQSRVIKNLNAYLDWNNVPECLRLDTEGVCAGLSSVYVKYVREKRENDFFLFLRYLAGDALPPEEKEFEVMQFVMQVLKTQSPKLFDPKLGQSHAYRSLLVNGEPLDSTFRLALVTEKQHWVTILNEIALQPGEAMLVGGIGHRVAVSKNHDNQYVIYDPNYRSGGKVCLNESDLMDELESQVFYYTSDLIGLKLTVFSNEDVSREHLTRDPLVYCERYFKAEAQCTSEFQADPMDTMSFASGFVDESVLVNLLELSGTLTNEQVFKLLDQAIERGHMLNFTMLLGKLQFKQTTGFELYVLVYHALTYGNMEAFLQICRSPGFSFDGFYDLRFAMIRQAAKGGNVALLQSVLDIIKTQSEQPDTVLRPFPGEELETSCIANAILLKDNSGKNALSYAMSGLSSQALEVLLARLEEEGRPLKLEERLDYGLYAIEQNNLAMVACLFGNQDNELISRELLETINISPERMRKTNLAILMLLKERGVPFDEISWQGIMAEKQHSDKGFVIWFGLLLRDFIWFLKTVVLRSKPISHSYKPALSANPSLLFEPPSASPTEPTDEPISETPQVNI